MAQDDEKLVKELAQKIVKEWKDIDIADYQEFLSNSAVHFSTKATNSNARAGGIRLGSDEKLTLPYVCLQTTRENVGLEYVSSVDQRILKQIEWCLDPETRSQIPGSKEEVEQIIADYHNLSNSHLDVGTDYVSPRLRQLLFPAPDSVETKYVGVTPLRSTTFCQLIDQKIKTANDNAEAKHGKKVRKLRGVHMGFGGANPQNSGRHTRSLHRPLMFMSPTEDKQTSRAFSIFYKGVSLHPSEIIMQDYRKWKLALLAKYPDGIPTNLRLKEQEKGIVQHIVLQILKKGEWAREILLQNEKVLPVSQQGLVSENVASVPAGVIDEKLRDQAWIDEFAQHMAKQIADFVFSDTEEKMGIAIYKQHKFQDWIKEVI